VLVNGEKFKKSNGVIIEVQHDVPIIDKSDRSSQRRCSGLHY